MQPKIYKTPEAFLKALTQKLKAKSQNENINLQRLRLKVAFERLMARIFAKTPYQWFLKGGHAMELVIKNPRATKDIDLALKEKALTSSDSATQNALIHEALIELGSTDLHDFFYFRVEAPILDLDAAPYGGARFPVIAEVDGRLYARFHLDVGVGDPNEIPFETKTVESFLGFAGHQPLQIPMIAIEQQFAEKIHAYTLPREGRFNSRVKDLVDLVLLINQGKLDRNKLKTAVATTFSRRRTHDFPTSLPSPPKQWHGPFEALAASCSLNLNLEAAFQILTKFFEDQSLMRF